MKATELDLDPEVIAALKTSPHATEDQEWFDRWGHGTNPVTEQLIDLRGLSKIDKYSVVRAIMSLLIMIFIMAGFVLFFPEIGQSVGLFMHSLSVLVVGK